jgi:hypothetical protein
LYKTPPRSLSFKREVVLPNCNLCHRIKGYLILVLVYDFATLIKREIRVVGGINLTFSKVWFLIFKDRSVFIIDLNLSSNRGGWHEFCRFYSQSPDPACAVITGFSTVVRLIY